jgi:HAE1 family hydrophobic/amphiphilic exporter-1
VRLLGEFQSVDELRELEIYLPNNRNPMARGSIIRLKDVATVRDGVVERTDLTRVNGKEDVTLVIQKTSDGNAIEVSEGVRQQIARIKSEYPDLNFTITQDEADAVKESLADLRLALGIAIFLVVVIIYLFLYHCHPRGVYPRARPSQRTAPPSQAWLTSSAC